MVIIENDSASGAEVYQLTQGLGPADNIYGEQPYNSPDGRRIAIRFYGAEGTDGALSILDLMDHSIEPVLEDEPRFPAFHAWGRFLYYQEEMNGRLFLKRCDYATLEKDVVAKLPHNMGKLSYGTVSQDNRYYAVSVHPGNENCFVLLVDLATGHERVIGTTTDQYFKHEQFSMDGTNRVLIQANGPGVKVVNLGVIEVDGGGIDWLPVDAPPVTPNGRWPGGDRYTPRCTGHEAWIGTSDRVFLSTAYDDNARTNIWTARLGQQPPLPVCRTELRFGHVSVSRCGRYWAGDAPGSEHVPIYIGSFETGKHERVVYSRTVHDGRQWSHTHPYLTADNTWLIFNSTRAGTPQVFGAKVPETFFKTLDESA